MYKCKICGKEYEKRYSYIGHCSSHYRGETFRKKRRKKPEEYYIERDKKKELNKLNIYKCKYCDKIFNNPQSLGGHVGRCQLNPNYQKTCRKIKENSTGKFHTQETKDKISKAMLKFLKENPDKVPYLINHSSKMSYPEEIFQNALIEMDIKGWVYQYRNSIYSYDFAWPKQKIDVEIDGATHQTAKVKKIDKRRDKFSSDNGWIVIRFTAKEVKKNVVKCINKILKLVP